MLRPVGAPEPYYKTVTYTTADSGVVECGVKALALNLVN